MKTNHPRTGQFYKGWELLNLNAIAENIRDFDQKKKERSKLKFWSRIVYLFLLSLLGGIIYLSFILDIQMDLF